MSRFTPSLAIGLTTATVFSLGQRKRRWTSYSAQWMRRRQLYLTLTSSTVGWQTFVVTTFIGSTSPSASRSDSASWSTSVHTTWHRRTCLNCAGRPATSKDAVNYAQRLAETSMFQDVDYQHTADGPSPAPVRQHGTLYRIIWKKYDTYRTT